MQADQPYPARIFISKTALVEVRLYATQAGDPQPSVQHQGIEYFHSGSIRINGGVETFDYLPKQMA